MTVFDVNDVNIVALYENIIKNKDLQWKSLLVYIFQKFSKRLVTKKFYEYGIFIARHPWMKLKNHKKISK